MTAALRRAISVRSACGLAALWLSIGSGAQWAKAQATATATAPLAVATPVATPPASEAARAATIRLLEARVQKDPLDFIAYNKLAGYYLMRLRETGSQTFLDLAARAAHASLAAIPADQNIGGFGVLAQVEFASHDFTAARDHAAQLMERDPGKSYPYEIFVDALLELGEYDRAATVVEQMQQRDESAGLAATVGTHVRRARLATLHGQPAVARKYLATALREAQKSSPASPETVAWCQWQMSETAFSTGDYASAERHASAALRTVPRYYRALAALGRVRAARGDLPNGIAYYEQAVRTLPDPTFVAALGDLYALAGRSADAAAQYALVEQIGHLSVASGNLYNRSLALFHADHDRQLEDACTTALREYGVRKDIYGADAVAWTALKAGRPAEAQAAMQDALRLGTRDARLLYHAGMIARASGAKEHAVDYLKRALALNPQFDPLQAERARRALSE